MICPNCGTEYACPCGSCSQRRGANDQNKFSFETDGIKCLTCGIVKDESWWMDEEIHQLCNKYRVNTLSEVLYIQQKNNTK